MKKQHGGGGGPGSSGLGRCIVLGVVSLALFAGDSAQAKSRSKPESNPYYDCNSAVAILEGRGGATSHHLSGTFKNREGFWYLTDRGLYFIPKGDQTTYVYLENKGAVAIWKKGCGDPRGEPAKRPDGTPNPCASRDYGYAVTDGQVPEGPGRFGETYAKIAARSCVQQVERSGTPHVWEQASPLAICHSEELSNRSLEKLGYGSRSECLDALAESNRGPINRCNEMLSPDGVKSVPGVPAPAILSNYKGTSVQSAYANALIGELKAKLLAKKEEYRRAFAKSSKWNQDWARKGLDACRRIGVIEGRKLIADIAPENHGETEKHGAPAGTAGGARL